MIVARKQDALTRSGLSLYRFSAHQYHQLLESGVLAEDDRVELLEGLVVEKMPHNPPHDATVTRISRRFNRALPEEWIVRAQCAINLSTSEPEPDIAVVSGPEEVYFRRHPRDKEAALLVEVSESSLERDRDNCRIYARARIPVYWIVNLHASAIEVYTEPRGGKSPAYGHQEILRSNDSVSVILNGKVLAEFRVADLLP